MASKLKMSFIVTCWGPRRPLFLPVLIGSLRCQTVQGWEALVIDSEDYPPNRFACDADPRVEYMPEILGQRHSHEDMYHACEVAAKKARGEWLAFPNDDAYLVPEFADRMIRKGQNDHLDLVYCNLLWGHDDTHELLNTAPYPCGIDKICFIVRREKMIPFSAKDTEYAISDGTFMKDMVDSGAKVGKLEQILAVHN